VQGTDNGDNLCEGDGGGPLVCHQVGLNNRNVLAGVVAFGIGCGEPNIPEILASIDQSRCYIDYDVKCKHGKEFIEHMDFEAHCGSWYKNVRELLDSIKDTAAETDLWIKADKYLRENNPETCLKKYQEKQKTSTCTLTKVSETIDKTSNCSPTNPKTRTVTTSNKLLGTWKPAGSEECGYGLRTTHIVGGQLSKDGDFPFMAIFGYKNTGILASLCPDKVVFNCGGSVINKWYVLTAAHCMYDENSTMKNIPLEVRLGEWKTGDDRPFETRKISEENVIIHEEYRVESNGIQVNDITLVRLNEPVDLFAETGRSRIAPICLPWSEDNFAYNWPGYETEDNAIVTGWGWVPIRIARLSKNICKFGVAAHSGVLRYAKVDINNKQCKKDFPEDFEPKTRICVGKLSGDPNEPPVIPNSCKGDSGGPLFIKDSFGPYTQIGIVSYGRQYGCSKKNTLPNIYTKVQGYIPWIEKNMKP